MNITVLNYHGADIKFGMTKNDDDDFTLFTPDYSKMVLFPTQEKLLDELNKQDKFKKYLSEYREVILDIAEKLYSNCYKYSFEEIKNMIRNEENGTFSNTVTGLLWMTTFVVTMVRSNDEVYKQCKNDIIPIKHVSDIPKEDMMEYYLYDGVVMTYYDEINRDKFLTSTALIDLFLDDEEKKIMADFRDREVTPSEALTEKAIAVKAGINLAKQLMSSRKYRETLLGK